MTRESTEYDSHSQELICRGDWDLQTIPHLKPLLFSRITWPTSGEVSINGSAIKRMDSAGAWLLTMWQAQLEKRGIKVRLQQFSEEYEHLLSIVQKNLERETRIPRRKRLSFFGEIGKSTMEQIDELVSYLSFIGMLTYESLRILASPRHLRWGSFASVIYRTGFLALPIIGLLSFMIGVVITYQMGIQLRSYGANAYIVDLLGVSILREFGPLLTAIMVAGRTGSSFTAQLGMMKINQEVDALNTLGVTPAELLLLPRIAGLFIALPLLTIWADIFGILGGMVMSKNMLAINYYDFLHRFPHVVKLRSLMIGLGKAPVFALIIASVGCFEGMRVSVSAESVGRNTTRSVVLAIFFIIVADAAFSVIFSKLRL